MDLVQEEQRDTIFREREAELKRRSLPLDITSFRTSIWDETLYKVSGTTWVSDVSFVVGVVNTAVAWTLYPNFVKRVGPATQPVATNVVIRRYGSSWMVVWTFGDRLQWSVGYVHQV